MKITDAEKARLKDHIKKIPVAKKIDLHGIPRLAACLLVLFFLTLPALALNDDFQNHPSNNASDVWNVWYDCGMFAYPVTIINYPTAYTQAKSMKITASSSGNCQVKVKNFNQSDLTYLSFVLRDDTFGGLSNIVINFYNSTNVKVFDSGQIQSQFTVKDALYEFVTSGGFVNLYRNGTFLANLGAITDTPYYIEFFISSQIGTFAYMTMDDVSTSGIVGSNNIYTELDSTFQTTDTIYAKYASPSSIYQQRVRSYSTGQIINTTAVNSTFNFTVYNRLDVFGTNYGYYQIYTTKDGILESSHNILYTSSISLGTISLNKDTYAIGDPMEATYTLVTPDFGTYAYKAYIVKGSTFATVSTQSISGSSGTLTFDTTGYTQDTYYIFLSRTSGGTQQDFAYDFASVNEAVNINGITYNAESGAVLPSVNVNNSQGVTWFNDTSDGSGVYNLTGMVVDVSININASIPNYSHTNWSFIPPSSGTQILDLYLIPAAPTISGTAILGLVSSYPWHQALNGATVNIWNATWNSTATSSATGYYIFNGLANDSTYSMNASYSDFVTASNVSVAVVNGSFVVQNFVLHPSYTLTVRAQDIQNLGYLSSFSVALSTGSVTSTTNGSVIITGLDYGSYSITTSATGYFGAVNTFVMNADRTVTAQLLKESTTVNNDVDFLASKVFEKFIVRSLFDKPFPGITINVFNGSNATVLLTGTTDTLGQAVFKLTKDNYYRIELSGGGLSNNLTYYIYAKEESYLITILSGFPTKGDLYNDISANLTYSTFNSTYSNLSIIYNDTRASTTALNFYSKNLTSNVTCTKSSSLNVITLNCTVQTSGIYQFGFNATSSIYGFFRQDKIINFASGNVSNALVPTKPPLATTGASQTVMNWGSIMLIVLVASLFSVRSIKFGALIVPTLAIILWAFGWLNAPWLLLSIAEVLGILTYLRLNEVKVNYS